MVPQDLHEVKERKLTQTNSVHLHYIHNFDMLTL